MSWFCKPLWFTAIVENNIFSLQIQYHHTIVCTTQLDHVAFNNVIYNSALLDYYLNLFKKKSSFRFACFAITVDPADHTRLMAVITQYKLWCLRNTMTCLMITHLSELMASTSSDDHSSLHSTLIRQGQRYL